MPHLVELDFMVWLVEERGLTQTSISRCLEDVLTLSNYPKIFRPCVYGHSTETSPGHHQGEVDVLYGPFKDRIQSHLRQASGSQIIIQGSSRWFPVLEGQWSFQSDGPHTRVSLALRGELRTSPWGLASFLTGDSVFQSLGPFILRQFLGYWSHALPFPKKNVPIGTLKNS